MKFVPLKLVKLPIRRVTSTFLAVSFGCLLRSSKIQSTMLSLTLGSYVLLRQVNVDGLAMPCPGLHRDERLRWPC
jgi:hypothetical protein